VGASIKTTLSVGLLLLLTGSVIAVATWPQGQTVALEGPHYGSAAKFDMGLAAAMMGLLLVLLAGIACGARRVESINQDTKP
jgi:hypothetical protein